MVAGMNERKITNGFPVVEWDIPEGDLFAHQYC